MRERRSLAFRCSTAAVMALKTAKAENVPKQTCRAAPLRTATAAPLTNVAIGAINRANPSTRSARFASVRSFSALRDRYARGLLGAMNAPRWPPPVGRSSQARTETLRGKQKLTLQCAFVKDSSGTKHANDPARPCEATNTDRLGI